MSFPAQVQLSNGRVARVELVDDTSVTLDLNHELAGKALTFDGASGRLTFARSSLDATRCTLRVSLLLSVLPVLGSTHTVLQEAALVSAQQRRVSMVRARALLNTYSRLLPPYPRSRAGQAGAVGEAAEGHLRRGLLLGPGAGLPGGAGGGYRLPLRSESAGVGPMGQDLGAITCVTRQLPARPERYETKAGLSGVLGGVGGGTCHPSTHRCEPSLERVAGGLVSKRTLGDLVSLSVFAMCDAMVPGALTRLFTSRTPLGHAVIVSSSYRTETISPAPAPSACRACLPRRWATATARWRTPPTRTCAAARRGTRRWCRWGGGSGWGGGGGLGAGAGRGHASGSCQVGGVEWRLGVAGQGGSGAAGGACGARRRETTGAAAAISTQGPDTCAQVSNLHMA